MSHRICLTTQIVGDSLDLKFLPVARLELMVTHPKANISALFARLAFLEILARYLR
jgi:hypothetical protein